MRETTRRENTRVYRPRPARLHTALADDSFRLFDDETAGALPGPIRGRKGNPPFPVPVEKPGSPAVPRAIGTDAPALAVVESR